MLCARGGLSRISVELGREGEIYARLRLCSETNNKIYYNNPDRLYLFFTGRGAYNIFFSDRDGDRNVKCQKKKTQYLKTSKLAVCRRRAVGGREKYFVWSLSRARVYYPSGRAGALRKNAAPSRSRQLLRNADDLEQTSPTFYCQAIFL